MSCNAQWLPNLEALKQHYHLVLAELWGHGQSPLPEASAFSIERYVAEFMHLRKQLGIKQWAVVGQSYAAGLVVRYAHKEPAHTTGVVVTNSRSAFGDIREAPRRRPDNNDTEIPKNNRQLPIHPIHARRFPDAVKHALVEAADTMPADAIHLGGQLAGRLNCLDIMGNLSCPSLLINGIYEKPFQADLKLLTASCPQLQRVDVEGGHAVNIEAASAFNNASLEFLDQCFAPPGV